MDNLGWEQHWSFFRKENYLTTTKRIVVTL